MKISDRMIRELAENINSDVIALGLIQKLGLPEEIRQQAAMKIHIAVLLVVAADCLEQVEKYIQLRSEDWAELVENSQRIETRQLRQEAQFTEEELEQIDVADILKGL